ncbi:hypothetical protein HK099_004661 [Clydaea vesicula]|uniref:PDZ-like domain-containing protein n=1 Tax=Clydaea vesicula TaxID=447962 RepID=A0AAD5XZG8_9FUNG|nr:hypothetical protein HK099_004661 [Clydaea vesicula]
MESNIKKRKISSTLCDGKFDELNWENTIKNSLNSIVSIRFSQVRSFDTEVAGSSQATGFVIDKEKGFILTNRHVACAGPFTGDAVFHNHEETEVVPVYRDPVHDFGFLKFDPKKIKYMDVTEITMDPKKAKVGLEIKVVGNDAGEKLSILSGSISRLNRNAPDYGEMTYNDFNTFYLQAASSTSGGSSAATDYFFPLDRVTRAFKFIQNGQQVPRGTIQVHWLHKPFDECRRLGLADSTESKFRKLFPDEIGMLVCEVVLPNGPSFNLIEEGDILLSVENVEITKFVPLEEYLDSNVGKKICIKIERGGEIKEFTIKIQDLHSITPDRYIEYGGAILNKLSYQLARQYCVEVSGIYLAHVGGMMRLNGHNGNLILSVDSKPTPTLEKFVEAVCSIPNGERVPVSYCPIDDAHAISVSICKLDSYWSGLVLSIRNDKTGLWDIQDLTSKIPKRIPMKPLTATAQALNKNLGVGALKIFTSLVKVIFYMPIRLDGYPASKKAGSGLILDKDLGIVVVGRNVVPIEIGDVTISIFDSILIPAEVIFIHPTQNFTFLKFDSKLIGNTLLESCVFSEDVINQGHKLSLFGFNNNQRPICIETTVTDMTAICIPQNSNPRFRATNFVGMTLDTPLAQQCGSGVLIDKEGRVNGLWLTFLGERNANGNDTEYHLGIPISPVRTIFESFKDSYTKNGVFEKDFILRGFGIEVSPCMLSHARLMGLNEEWVDKVIESNPSQPRLFFISRVENSKVKSEKMELANGAEIKNEDNNLKELDLILSMNDKVASRITDFEPLTNVPEIIKFKILRNKKEKNIIFKSITLNELDRKVFLVWSGAVLQEPYRAVLQQFNKTKLPSLVYCSGKSKGSPAYQYGIGSTLFITAVDSKDCYYLEEFLDLVRNRKDGTYIRIKLISFDLIPVVVSIKIDKHYWPTIKFVKNAEAEHGWKKELID